MFDLEKFNSQGRRTPRGAASCPECGGPAETTRNKWVCLAHERDEMTGVRMSVCGARGRVAGNGDLCVTQGSNGLWKDLITEG